MVRLAFFSLVAAILIATGGGRAAAEDERASLAAELGWVKFRVAAGQIYVVNTSYRESKDYETGNPLVGEAEKFAMIVSARDTILNYERTTPDERLTASFGTGGELTIQRQQLGARAHTPFTFTQRRDEGMRLAVGEGKSQQIFRGRTLWHLILLAPTPTREQLVPVLESLRPGWQLQATAAELETALVAAANSGKVPDREAWAKLVEQLGSDRFTDRRAAERQLREAGPPVVAYLQSIEVDRFDAERRQRVDRLLESLSTTADDMPQRIAMWLVDDPTIWVAILASSEVEHRRTAHAQLEKLLAMKIEFDADADANVRGPLVEEVRRRVAP